MSKPSKLVLQGHAPTLPKRVTGSSVASSSGGVLQRRPERDVMLIARKLLLAPESQRSRVLNARNREGDTLLHACCKSGYSSVVSTLLEQGCPDIDIDARTEGGFSALAYAARGGFQDIVMQLCASGAETAMLFGRDAARFQPLNADMRPIIREAVLTGAAVYAENLKRTVLHGCVEPFSSLPEVLVSIVVEYVLPGVKPLRASAAHADDDESERGSADDVAVAAAAAEGIQGLDE